MKLFLFLCLSMLNLFAACNSMFFNGFIPSPSINAKFLCYEEFATMYNLEQGKLGPIFSAERLTADRLQKASKLKRVDSFHDEDAIPYNQQVSVSEYKGSGYDKGHMAPNKDFSNEHSQFECFTMANMIPQTQENNRGVWSKLEGFVRHLTFKNKEVYVLTGPMYDKKSIAFGTKTLVPSYVWKAIYIPSLNKGIVFIATNNKTPEVFTKSIDEFEQIIGFRLFQNSPSFGMLDTSEFRFNSTIKQHPTTFDLKSLLKYL